MAFQKKIKSADTCHRQEFARGWKPVAGLSRTSLGWSTSDVGHNVRALANGRFAPEAALGQARNPTSALPLKADEVDGSRSRHLGAKV